jgi:hypothetical protein
MGPHTYGQYLHILMPAGSDDSHDGPQPWEGITGRVKQETNRLLGVIERTDAAMQSRVDANKEALLSIRSLVERSDTTNKEAIKGVEAKLEAQLGDVQSKLDSQQSKLESIEALLASLVAEKQ